MTGLQMTGGGPDGYGPGGGAPPGGGYGPPPGGGFGGPPPGGGGFGGPPQGGYGGPPPGGYGGPPMPPMMPPSPPQRSGPNVGLIIGLGCLGFALLGGLGIGGMAFYSFRRASAIAASIPTTVPPPPRITGTSVAPAEATSTMKAELHDLRDFKGTFGKARYFVGEIVNTGEAPIGFPSAKVTLLDSSSTAIDSGTCASVVHVLAPGAKVPCTFLTLKSDSFATTKIEITPMRAFSKKEEANLKIDGAKLTPKKGYSPVAVEGKITNLSAFKAKSVWALVSLYGADGKIVGAEQSLVAGADLESGSSALFSSKIYNVAAPPVTFQVKAIGYAE